MRRFLYIVRVLIEDRWAKASRPLAEGEALTAQRRLSKRYEKVRLDEIHLCEREGCPAHTPYPLCRRHDSEERAAKLAALPVPPTILKPDRRRDDRRRAARATALAASAAPRRPPGPRPSEHRSRA